MVNKKISNRLSYTIISVVILILFAIVIYAQTAPNPGHTIAQIAQPSGCSAGQVLQWTGSTWTCTSSGNVGLKAFVGKTSATYIGDLGGYTGANAKCAAEFGTGARMCSAADFVLATPSFTLNPSQPLVAIMWYSSFTAGSYTNDAVDCRGWTQANVVSGPVWLYTDNGVSVIASHPERLPCTTPEPIACCK